MSSLFTVKRFLPLLKNDLLSVSKNIVIKGSVVLLLTFLWVLLPYLFTGATTYTSGTLRLLLYQKIYLGILWGGGIVFTARIFPELYNRERNIAFFLLPASSFEKMFSRLVLAALLFPLALLLFLSLGSLLLETLFLLFIGSSLSIPLPGQQFSLNTIPYFWVVQSLFFGGAVFFKKNSIIKTLLFTGLAGILFTTLTMVLVHNLFSGNSLFGKFSSTIGSHIGFSGHPEALGTLSNHYYALSKLIFFGIIPIALYIASYFKISEIESCDAL